MVVVFIQTNQTKQHLLTISIPSNLVLCHCENILSWNEMTHLSDCFTDWWINWCQQCLSHCDLDQCLRMNDHHLVSRPFNKGLWQMDSWFWRWCQTIDDFNFVWKRLIIICKDPVMAYNTHIPSGLLLPSTVLVINKIKIFSFWLFSFVKNRLI